MRCRRSRALARTLVGVLGIAEGCGDRDDDGDGAAGSSETGSSTGTSESSSGEVGTEDTGGAIPPCDPSVPPPGDVCMRACALYDTCGEQFSNCLDTQCCIESCESQRLLFYQRTPVCGEIADAMYECVAGLDCDGLAMITDTLVAPTDPCAAEIDAWGTCWCGASDGG